MAELFPIDQIFDNPAYPGLLANAFINAGIPAFTPEIGAPRVFDHGMIPLFVEGTINVLEHHGIIRVRPAVPGRTPIYVGNSLHAVIATHGGFVELLVKLNDKVEVGQKIAIQRNTFGEVVAEYTSGVSGEVAACRTDAIPSLAICLLLPSTTAPSLMARICILSDGCWMSREHRDDRRLAASPPSCAERGKGEICRAGLGCQRVTAARPAPTLPSGQRRWRALPMRRRAEQPSPARAPRATETCSLPTILLLVGSKPCQPAPGR